MSTETEVLIIGGGVFGLSTALDLKRNGYRHVKVIDRAPIPSPYSAGHDLNKIVRAEYEDPFYTELALHAIEQWQTPFWSDHIRMTGYILATSANSPQKARDTLAKSFSSIEHHPSYPPGSFQAINSPSDIQSRIPQLKGPMKGWKGYYNKHAGYAQAWKALNKAYQACIEMDVQFVTGDDGHAVQLLYNAENGKKVCTGVKTASGRIHTADTTILCLGAHVATLLPAIANQIIAKSWAVGHLQLTTDEVKSMTGIPVVNCRDLGFFFEPDADTGLLKLCAQGQGYTNYVEDGVSVPAASNDVIPAEDELLLRRLIEETMPQFANRPLVNKIMCWCGDTADSDFIIDLAPGCDNLIVASGDSGHAFKMLPVAGEWVRKVVEDGRQTIPRWRWKNNVKPNNDISWRVGKIRDIKDAIKARL